MSSTHSPEPDSPPRRWPWVLGLSGPAVWVGIRFAPALPGVSAETLARHLSTPLVAGLDALTRVWEHSVAELLLATLVAGLLVLAFRRLRSREISRRRRWMLVGRDLLLVASPLWALFQLSWSTHFQRPPLDRRLGLGELPPAEVEAELSQLASPLIEATNRAYRELHGLEDRGRPTEVADPRALDRALEESWQRLARSLPTAHLAEGGRGPVKPLFLSPLFRRMGTSGVFSPFTGEAHYVSTLPGSQLPMVWAHEKAHQRGVAPEDEANFLGFLAALRSDAPVARYAALLFAQRQVLGELARRGHAGLSDWLAARHPGVQRDVDARVEYWSRYRGRTRRLARAMNDRYLKAHGVEEGVRSYALSLDLLLRGRTRWSADLPELQTRGADADD